MTPTGRCPRCLEPVILARTEAHGKPFLLNPIPDPDGNQALMQPPAGPLQTRQLRDGEEPRSYEIEGRFMPHLVTCTGRKQAPVPVPLPDNVTPINRAPSRRGNPSPKGTR